MMRISESHNKARRGGTLRAVIAGREGTTAVVLAVSLAALAGIWALSIDLGRAWNLGTELQNAADAAALACASQLDQQPGARSRARLAATGGLVANRQTFASDGAGDNVTISAADITFLVDLTTRAVATGDADANYCQVAVSPRTVNFSLAQLVINRSSAAPRAVAVAELTAAQCITPPVMICNPNEPAPFDATAYRGFGITLKDSSGPGLSPGNFGLLGLPSSSGALLSAAKIRDAWARVRPLVDCFNARSVQTRPGQATAVRQGLNMRFDIFPQGTHQVPPGEPPVESNPNYTPSLNTVKGLEKSGSQCSYSHPQGWNKPAQPYEGAPPADAMGFPRDGCAYNGGACDTDAGGTALGDGNWDIATYMALNHPGVAASTVPDLDGVAGKSRYEVYRWETDSGNPAAAAPESPSPICHSAAVATPVDRRVINAAVVDCGTVSGTTAVQPGSWISLFLTEPMGVHNGNNDLYAEVIGPADVGDDAIARLAVRLVE